MKIGIVINSSWNVFNFRRKLVEELIQEGHEVIAITPEDEFTSKLKELGCKHIHISLYGKGANPFNDLKLTHHLYKAYKKAQLDMVLHFTIKPNIYGSLAAYFAGIPSINNVTGLGTVFLRKDYRSVIAKALYRISFKLPFRIFFQNKDDRKLFLEEGLVSYEKAGLLPGSGIDLEHFQPLMTHTNKGSQPFKFLLISRLIYDKGILEFIEAIRLVRKRGLNATFQVLGKLEPIAGLGVSKQELNTWIEEGLIEYLGSCNDVRPVIDNADCVVLPSYREGTPRSLLEAASKAKPIVTTDVPGCREVVKNGFNGFLCRVKDAKDLAEKMEVMMNLSEQEISKMGRNSRYFVELKFDEQNVVEKYKDAIKACYADDIYWTEERSVNRIPASVFN